MNYIKARYPNQSRSYTFKTSDNVSAGDTVVTDKGAKLTVVGEADTAWVETYGADKVAVVKKYGELEKLRDFLIEHNFKGTQTFDSRNIVGDSMTTIYNCDGIIVDYCGGYEYLEIFGLTDEEYLSLKDILDIN